MIGSQKSILDQYDEYRILLIVDEALTARDGGRALQVLPFLQAIGFHNFSYFDSWRPRYKNNYLVGTYPGEYEYVSLSRRDFDTCLAPLSDLAFFTRQVVESDIFRVCDVFNFHLRMNRPERICLIADSKDFTLQDVSGRTITEEPWFFQHGKAVNHRAIVSQAIAQLQEFVNANLRYCGSWAHCGVALALNSISELEPRNQGELLECCLDAPYLSLWKDITALSPHSDMRPDNMRAPVEEPWLVLSRYYGFDPRAMERFWYEAEIEFNHFIHPFTRDRILNTQYSNAISNAMTSTMENPVASQLMQQFVISNYTGGS